MTSRIQPRSPVTAMHLLGVVAAQQHGLVTTAQLADCGFTSRAIAALHRSGRLRRMHRGLYCIHGSPETTEQRLLAACLAAGPEAVASHRAAAWLWGSTLEGIPNPEITTLRPSHPELGVIAHRRIPSPLDSPHDQIIRHGIPTTSPLATLVALGAVSPLPVVRATLDGFVSGRLVTVAGVIASLRRLGGRGRRGAGVLRQILESRGLGLEDHDGTLEPMFAELCQRFGLPRPAYQFPIVLGGRQRRIDFAYAPLRIAIEVDGYEFHSRFEVFQDDRLRANELELLGWTVLRFTWHQVVHRPDLVAKTIRSALAAARSRAA